MCESCETYPNYYTGEICKGGPFIFFNGKREWRLCAAALFEWTEAFLSDQVDKPDFWVFMEA